MKDLYPPKHTASIVFRIKNLKRLFLREAYGCRILRMRSEYSTPNRTITRLSFLSTVSMVLIIVPSSFFFLWICVVSPKIEGVAAFCSPHSRSALVSKNNCFSNDLASSRKMKNSRESRLPSLFLAATTARMDRKKNGSNNTTTKVSSTVGTSQPTQTPSETKADKSPRPTKTVSTTEPSSKNNSINQDNENDDAGVVGNWENLEGNWVLRPTFSGDIPGVDDFDNSQPRAVIHFLGGALVGKAPHVTYRYLLEKLAAEGFLVVATPFNLSFDHLATCDEILTKFEAVAPTLAKQYGALPVVGIGHSCGALLQVLISSLFPDTPRAANALLSFNNKPVSEAVPFFEEVFAPLFSSLAIGPDIGGSGSNADGSPTTTKRGPSSNDSLVLGLKLAKAASQGNLPSDELLQEAQRVFGSRFQAAAASLPIPFPPFFGNDRDQTIKIPTEIRESYAKWAEPSVTALSKAGVLPIIHETIISLEQIPKLIDEVSDIDSVSSSLCFTGDLDELM